jgi:hypothetical protein
LSKRALSTAPTVIKKAMIPMTTALISQAQIKKENTLPGNSSFIFLERTEKEFCFLEAEKA